MLPKKTRPSARGSQTARARARQSTKPARRSRARATDLRTSLVPAPAALGGITRNPGGGLSDIRDLRLNCFGGFMRAGDGSVLGTAQNIYATEPTETKNYTSIIPFAPADASCGQSYVADLVKHFARQIIKKVVLKYIPGSSGMSTANSSAQIALAPYRGGDFQVSLDAGKTANPISRSTVAGMQGSIQFPSWLPAEIDMTKYIAGGSGARQDEFDIANPVAITSATDLASTVPCGFACSGDAAVAMNGNTLGTFVWDAIIDLVDFIGGLSQSNPARQAWEKQWEERRARDRECEERRRSGKVASCDVTSNCALCQRCSKHEVTPVEITTTSQPSTAPSDGVGTLRPILSAVPQQQYFQPSPAGAARRNG